MTKEEIYERMTISMTTPDPEIPCEFDDGKPCAELYGKVCDARLRIAERTGLDFEDADLLEMVEGMEEIAKICALRMFDYGARFGNAELPSQNAEKTQAVLHLMDKLAEGQRSGETEGWLSPEEVKDYFDAKRE